MFVLLKRYSLPFYNHNVLEELIKRGKFQAKARVAVFRQK